MLYISCEYLSMAADKHVYARAIFILGGVIHVLSVRAYTVVKHSVYSLECTYTCHVKYLYEKYP
jgi:hypothetical protein